MLRRKLLLILGPLVVLLLMAAIGAILLLQNVLNHLSRINEEAMSSSAISTQFNETLAVIDREYTRLRLGVEPEELTVNLQRAVVVLDDQAGILLEPFHDSGPTMSELDQRIRDAVPRLASQVDATLASAVPAQATTLHEAFLAEMAVLQQHMLDYDRLSNRHMELDHEQLVSKFRNIMLGLGLIFLVLINVSVIFLLNAATMILRPVNALIAASRHLAREDFSHRVKLDRRDEFGELGTSLNHLAEQLQRNEQRKVETMQQVARALNHELNNALSIIELQLKVVEKSQSDRQKLEKPLLQIHETLQRIGKTVDALKRVRRIVLTDYVSGVKMLDLERSIEEGPPQPEIETRPMTEIKTR